MVEETSAAARNLANEVGGLSDQAGRFNVGSRRNAHAPASGDAASAPASQQVDASDHASPVKSLPPAAIAALTRKDEECDVF
jgi:methyl-accepting chemotaxis protein